MGDEKRPEPSERPERPSVDRMLDFLVYAPVGLASYARDVLPGMVGAFAVRGKSQVEQLRAHEPPADLADLRRLVDDGLGVARTVVEGLVRQCGPTTEARTPTAPASAARSTAGEEPEGTVAPEPATEDDASTADSLAVPDYDHLSASQVVARLDGLDPESLRAIERYERAHRARSTILGKIAQLL